MTAATSAAIAAAIAATPVMVVHAATVAGVAVGAARVRGHTIPIPTTLAFVASHRVVA